MRLPFYDGKQITFHSYTNESRTSFSRIKHQELPTMRIWDDKCFWVLTLFQKSYRNAEYMRNSNYA